MFVCMFAHEIASTWKHIAEEDSPQFKRFAGTKNDSKAVELPRERLHVSDRGRMRQASPVLFFRSQNLKYIVD